MNWLKEAVAQRGRPWHLIGNQVVFTPIRFPSAVLGVPSVGYLFNSDQWDGYQSDQAELIGHLGRHGRGDRRSPRGEPWVRYLDGVGHGYTLIDVTPEGVQADDFHTPRPASAQPDPRVVASVVPVYATSWQTTAGSRRVTPAARRVGPRSDQPRRLTQGFRSPSVVRFIVTVMFDERAGRHHDAAT